MSNSNLPIQNQDFGCKVLHVSFYTTHRKTLLINNLQKIEIDKSKTPPWHHRSIFSFTVSILTAGKLKMFWLHFVPLSWDFVSFHFLEKVAFAPFLRRSPSCRRGYCANRHFTYHISPYLSYLFDFGNKVLQKNYFLLSNFS